MGSQRVGQDWATELKWIDVVLVLKNLSANAGNLRVASLIPGSGRSPKGGHGNPLQYSCLENPHGQRSLAGFSPWDRKELDVTEWLSTIQDIKGEWWQLGLEDGVLLNMVTLGLGWVEVWIQGRATSGRMIQWLADSGLLGTNCALSLNSYWLWTSYVTSLCLSFLIYKMRITRILTS